MLELPQLPAAAVERLKARLSPELADYRVWREHVERGREWEPPLPVVTHVLQRWIIPRGISLTENPGKEDASFDELLDHGGRWHAQITAERPPKPKPWRYYARVRQLGGKWTVEWIGYRWHGPVSRGLAWLEEREANLDAEVRLLSTSLYKFTSLWLAPRPGSSNGEAIHRHLVVSSSKKLPLFRLLDQEELRRLLIERFGSEYGIGGISNEKTRRR